MVGGAGAATEEARIVIKGSNTFGEELAPKLIAHYREGHPDVTIELEAKGSESGLAALLDGKCDIASASRWANEDEQRLVRSRGLRLKGRLLGYYGIAVIVNRQSVVEGLSDAQIRDVFTGTVRTWASLGGRDAPIHLYIRDPVSGTYLGFQEMAMERMPYASSAKRFQRYSDIADAVVKDPDGIGYVSMELAQNREVKALSVNRVSPSFYSVNEGDYPYSRGLRFYTLEGRESRAVQDFIAYVLSKDGQNVIKEAGFVGCFEPTRRWWELD